MQLVNCRCAATQLSSRLGLCSVAFNPHRVFRIQFLDQQQLSVCVWLYSLNITATQNGKDCVIY